MASALIVTGTSIAPKMLWLCPASRMSVVFMPTKFDMNNLHTGLLACLYASCQVSIEPGTAYSGKKNRATTVNTPIAFPWSFSRISMAYLASSFSLLNCCDSLSNSSHRSSKVAQASSRPRIPQDTISVLVVLVTRKDPGYRRLAYSSVTFICASVNAFRASSSS